MRSKIGWILATAALVVMFGCGKATPPPPIALPPPIPQTNGYPGGIGAVACGGAVSSPGGMGPQTFSARLANASPGSYVQLTVIPQQYGSWLSQSTQVAGSITVLLTDNQPPQFPGQPVQQVPPICGQTQPNAAQVNVYASQDQSIAMVLYGTANLPSYNQYSPYPTGQYSQTSVTAYVGYGCGAWLDTANQRLRGCIGLQYGGQGQIKYYTTE